MKGGSVREGGSEGMKERRWKGRERIQRGVEGSGFRMEEKRKS